MANIIKPKRSNTAAKVPNTTELTSGELGVNMADRKVYINNGTAVVQVGAGNLSGLGDVAIATPTNGQALTYNSTSGKWENAAAGAGTVTSVGITAGTGVTVSNSPITTSGNIAVGLSTKLTAIENLSGAGFFTQNGSGEIAGRTLQAGTGISIAHGNGSSQDPTITNSAPDQTVVLTGAGATSITGTYPSFTISSVNTTYSPATSTVAGLIELASDTAQTVAANAVTATASRTYGLQVNANGQGVVNVPWTNTTYSLATSTVLGLIELGSNTQQTVAANAVSATASRSYALQVNAAGQGVVNVPWTDTTYTLPAATSTIRGGIELNSDTAQTVAANAVTATASRTYGLQVNSDGQGVINVPWTDTVYSLPAATSTIRGGIELGSDTAQTVAANAVSATASRSYALQVNADGQGVVNVPWTDTNSGGTVTSVSGTGTASGLSLSGTVTTSGNLTLSGTVNSLAAGTYAIGISGNAATATNVAYTGLTGTVPTWNQNTTGTAANVTGTVAVANGGTGATTAAAARTNLGAASTSLATSTVAGLIELGSDTAQTVAPNAVSATASRSYALQLNAAGQGVVNVPWTDTNSGGTVTSVGGTGTVNGITLSGTVTSSGNLTLGGTLSGVSLTTQVSGTLPIANGGTGATTAANALTNLGAYAASNPSAYINTAGARSALSFTAGSGAYNSTTGVITIPTNTNQLTNGAGFVTSSGVTSVATGTGLTGGTITTTGTISLANTAVTAGSYTSANFTVDAQGRITAASNGSAAAIGSNTQVAYNNAGTMAGSANLTFNGTNLTCGGTITANSDESLKTNWRDLPDNFVDLLALVKSGTYDRIDQELTQDGVSAQSLQPLLPNSVLLGEDGKLSVAYGNAALVACIKLAQRVLALEQQLKAKDEMK